MKLKKNPFTIAPLFRNFKDMQQCVQDEKLFMLAEQGEMDLEILLATDFLATLERRIQSQNSALHIKDIFSDDALEYIFQQTKGIRKDFLRVCENALGLAVAKRKPKITLEECRQVFQTGEEQLVLDLKDIQIKILRYLAQKKSCSPSEQTFISAMKVTRTYLRTNLEELAKQGYVQKEKHGRQNCYSIASPYRAYFAKEE